MPRHMWRTICDVGLGRKYGHTGDETQDCVRLAYAVLVAAYPDVDVESMSAELHLAREGMLGSTANVDAVVALGIGEHVDRPTEPGWYYCQGWRWVRGRVSVLRGHCWLWRVERDGSSWIAEATTGTHDWVRPATWEEQASRYSEGSVARLL